MTSRVARRIESLPFPNSMDTNIMDAYVYCNNDVPSCSRDDVIEIRGAEMKNSDRHPLPLQVLKKFRLIYGSVRQQFRDVEETCGVSGSQLWLLQEVARKAGVGVSELAERLSIHQSTCSQLVDKLVARDLIIKERSSEDQRRVGLTLSETAQALLANAPGPAEGILPEALMALPKEELVTLDASLAQLIAQLRIRDDKYADKPMADW